MSGKSPIDVKRESAFSARAGAPGEGNLREFYSIEGALLMIKDAAIYKLQTADQIDPGRTSIDIHHVQQRLYSIGYESEIVGKTLLTAKSLFSNGALDPRFDRTKLLTVVLAFFDDVVAACSTFEALDGEQEQALGRFEDQKRIGISMLLPSVPDVEGKAKMFIMRAEHGVQHLFSLCKIFYLVQGRWFDGVVSAAKAAHPTDEGRLGAIERVAKYAKFVRNCRNCVEHPKADERVAVSNFAMLPTSELALPTIEIIHKDTPEPSVPVATFMHGMLCSLLTAGEELMGFLAGQHVMPGLEATVASFPLEERRNPHVRYYFATNWNGALVPIG